jgi:hypothetical protein
MELDQCRRLNHGRDVVVWLCQQGFGGELFRFGKYAWGEIMFDAICYCHKSFDVDRGAQ